MIETARIIIALFYLLTGSISDLKTREVLDFANFSLISIGVALNLLYASVYEKWAIALESLLGLGIFVAIAFIMYYAGQWGGGDSKMLMGLGALFGMPFSFDKLPLLVEFFINTLIVGAIYGLFWSLTVAIMNWKKVSRRFAKNSAKAHRIKMYIIFGCGALLAAAFIVKDSMITVFLVSMTFVAIFSFYMWIFVKSVEKEIMYNHIDVDKLTEGDWIVNDVKVEGEYITGPKELGITGEAIEKLKKYKEKGKIKKVLVKEGIPFVPSFLIAYIVTLIFPNYIAIFFL
ncbi:MAG: A24 family peptidase [Nanobdellota archaeon]